MRVVFFSWRGAPQAGTPHPLGEVRLKGNGQVEWDPQVVDLLDAVPGRSKGGSSYLDRLVKKFNNAPYLWAERKEE